MEFVPRSVLRAAIPVLLLALPGAGARAAGEPPYDTEPARVLPGGRVRVDAGVELAAGGARPLFPEESGNSAALRGGVRTGLGSWGEVRAWGDLIRWYDPEDGSRASGAGDWRVATKVRLGPAGRRLGWAAQMEVKLPVASDNQGLGTDLADVELRVLAGGLSGRHRWDANGGLAILGAPFRERSQVDVLTYAARYEIGLGDRWHLGAELAGRGAGDFTPARSALRLGARAVFGRWEVNAAAAFGLARGSPDLEARIGMQVRFDRRSRKG